MTDGFLCGILLIVEMRTVSIIKDGEFMKSHIDYPVTNAQWQRIDNFVLWDFLKTLHLLDPSNSLVIFQGTLDVFYLRNRHNPAPAVTKIDYNSDPWNRRFVIYPPMLQFSSNDAIYKYHSYISYKRKIDVNIIVTTVNNMRVYCVDAIKNV